MWAVLVSLRSGMNMAAYDSVRDRGVSQLTVTEVSHS